MTGRSRNPGSNLGIVVLSTGDWRRTMGLTLLHTEEAGIMLSLPISVRLMRWNLDCADDLGYFSNHEHDMGLPPSYGRRCWGFYAGTRIEVAQARFGFIGLDRYKDWIVDYAEDPALARYPGAFFMPAQLAKLKTALDRHPDRDFLNTWYLLSGKVKDAERHAEEVIERLKHPYHENDFFLIGLPDYRKSQHLAFTCKAEDALACPELPGKLRQELRRRLALYAYVLSDADFNPRGTGSTWATTT